MSLQVAAFYGFTAMAELPSLRAELLELAGAAAVRGTILLAGEGVNGTICGPEPGVLAVLARLRALPGLAIGSNRAATPGQRRALRGHSKAIRRPQRPRRASLQGSIAPVFSSKCGHLPLKTR